MIEIVTAQAADLPEIESLLDARFGPARRNRTAYRLREGVTADAALSFVARDGDRLVGSVQCWPLQLRSVAGAILPLTLLGPVACAADRQGEGIATRLMQAALRAVDAAARAPVLLIGDAPFYGRFGFSAAATAGWMLPGPVDRDRLLLRGLADALPAVAWVEPAGVRRAA
ncbi:GNAT family N-acetyltransferase [Sandarakinorhabdus sp. DWP1-3-1]|uniref:GNAT family N-acetyltransferase n=1 Tax=Sandarakinorhabdus sp. DWP1-3-1 TaxID=2804627 RepID=UPI003CE6A882